MGNFYFLDLFLEPVPLQPLNMHIDLEHPYPLEMHPNHNALNLLMTTSPLEFCSVFFFFWHVRTR